RFQEFERVAMEFARGLAHHRILQDRGIGTGEFPSLEEWCPVDVGDELCQWVIAQQRRASDARRGWPISRPVGRMTPAPGFGERQQRARSLLVAVLHADPVV